MKKINTINKVEKLFASIKIFLLQKESAFWEKYTPHKKLDRRYPALLKIVNSEQMISSTYPHSKEIFSEDFTAEFTIDVGEYASRILIEQGLWKQRNTIGIYRIKNDHGIIPRKNCKYKLYYLF